MPPFVRFFAKLFIGFPGLLIWFYGCLFAVGGSGSLIYGRAGRLWLESLLMFLGGFVVAQIGHGMRLATKILTGDPKLRFAGSNIGERIGWDAAVQLACILFVGSATATIAAINEGPWWRLTISLPLFGASTGACRYLFRKRSDLHYQWAREGATRETERASMELDAQRLQEKLEAPHFLRPER